jgi:hypothetical protein
MGNSSIACNSCLADKHGSTASKFKRLNAKADSKAALPSEPPSVSTCHGA